MPESLSPQYYSATLIDHFQNPRNAGAMDDADVDTSVTNPVCGDSLRLFMKIRDGRVERASFLSSGCPASIATSSVATEMITGLPLGDAEALTREDFTEAVGGLPKSKVHCSVLAAAAVRNGIAEWRERNGGATA